MTADMFDDVPSRPLWLTTLADLSLLLVGFFVFLQANPMEGPKLAESLRAGFGVPSAVPQPMAVEMATVTGFAAGEARADDMAGAIIWAQMATRDRRTLLTVTGESDGSSADVDAVSGSAALLASDRARHVAAALIKAGAIAPERIRITTATGQRRVALTLGFNGEQRCAAPALSC